MVKTTRRGAIKLAGGAVAATAGSYAFRPVITRPGPQLHDATEPMAREALEAELMGLMEIEAAERAEESLVEFARQAWPIIEPKSPFEQTWHIDAIAEHLQAVSIGELHRLLINVPYGTGKSLFVSVCWPVWDWIDNAARRFLTVSHREPLALRDALKSRRIMRSPWFRRNWGNRFHMRPDQDTKHRYENSQTGARVSSGLTRGGAMGERADIIICDDPHNIKQAAFSATQRLDTLETWDLEVETRLNRDDSGGIVIVMQRLHQNDLSGHVLDGEADWEHLMIPMEFEPERKCFTRIGWEDPRTHAGELMWPSRKSAQWVADERARLGGFGASGQLQQTPIPREGGIFQRSWFDIVKQAPVKAARCRFWDLASTKEAKGIDPDWTVGALAAATDDGVTYLEDVIRVRETPGEVEKIVRQTAVNDGKLVRIRMEQEPGASGKIVIDHYARHVLPGFTFKGVPSGASKQARAEPMSAAAEAGNFKLVRGGWVMPWLAEAEVFPSGDSHDDQVDAASGAFNDLWGMGERKVLRYKIY